MHQILLLVLACTLLSASNAWKLTHSKWMGAFASAIAISSASPVHAFGPTDVAISIIEYKAVDLCNGQKPIMPGQKAAQGLFPVCIEVTADVNSPSKDTLSDVSIYGFVKENDAGNSVLPNNPDFKSDSGQYAMIKTVSPGSSKVTFQFVAAVSADPSKEAIPPLTFFKTKAIAFPGGNKFQPLSNCEIDPRSCFDEDEE